MGHHVRQLLRQKGGKYLAALLFVAAAYLLRLLVPGILGGTPYLAFYPAVVAAAAFGGLGPGLLATIIAQLCVDLVFDETPGRMDLSDVVVLGRLVIFALGGIGIGILAEWRQRAQRRQQEQADVLQEALRKYRAVAEHTHDWEFWLAPDGRFLYISPACLNVTGYPAEAFLANAELAEHIIHPDDKAHYLEHRGQGHDACVTPETEFRIIHRDGGVRWIGHACVPIHDEAGAFIGIRGSNRDITERKLAEQAVAESRQRLAGIIDSAMDAIITVDEGQKILIFNPAAEKMFGCPAAQAIGSVVERFIPERFRAGHAEHIRHFGQTGETARAMGSLGEISGVRINGEEFPIEASISQVSVEGRKLFTVILRDITQRQRAKEALRESEIRYRTLFESIDQGFCIVEVMFDAKEKAIDYRFMVTNPSFARQTGLSEVEGKRIRELVPKHEELWFKTYGAIALTGQPARFQARAEQLGRWYDVYAFRVGQPENRHVAILFDDITERKAVQAALEAAKLSAERAKAAAEQASRAKDHFMAVLSHELRNPLTPVLATAALLQQDGRLDGETREHLEVIRRNAELEARLIDDLLDVTRISRGKVELNLRPIQLSTVLRHAAEVCQPDIEARGLHFGMDLKDQAHLVHADAGRLQQVFWNIIKNAVKFTPRNGCVGVRCTLDDGQAIVEVSDSGVGIEPEALTRIFNAFEQAGASITREFGGLGLGLAISKALVEMHGGTITARSEGKGKGATFVVRLPLASFPATAPETTMERRPPSARNGPKPAARHILLVEDHGDTARIMTRLLAKQGHEVWAAGDIASALELAGQQSFDIVLSDLGLPDGSGLDLIRGLHARGHHFPGIALSGYGQEEDVRQSLAAGFSLHLTKPVDLGRLAQAVATLTEQSMRR